MTWPFENDTSAIVKKLADRSMKADKRRNAFIIITIAFAVSLMMVLALYNLGTDRENRLYLQGRYQGSFINSTSTVFEKLEHNNQIEAVGKEAAMGTSRINDYTLDVYYRDQNALELKGVTDLLGKMPEAENEIIVEDFASGNTTKIKVKVPKGGHSGSDVSMMKDFVELVAGGGTAKSVSAASESIESHLMALAAEDSREHNGVVYEMKGYGK